MCDFKKYIKNKVDNSLNRIDRVINMVVDTIKRLIYYFVDSTEPNKIAVESATTTEAPVTMSTAIAPNDDDDVQSLYTIVENGLKDNVSID